MPQGYRVLSLKDFFFLRLSNPPFCAFVCGYLFMCVYMGGVHLLENKLLHYFPGSIYCVYEIGSHIGLEFPK